MRRDEGYIKFSYAHEAGPPPSHPQLHDLMRIRDDLHEWELIGVLPDGIGYGNISTRIPDSNRFLVTGSGTGFKFPIEPIHFSSPKIPRDMKLIKMMKNIGIVTKSIIHTETGPAMARAGSLFFFFMTLLRFGSPLDGHSS